MYAVYDPQGRELGQLYFERSSLAGKYLSRFRLLSDHNLYN